MMIIGPARILAVIMILMIALMLSFLTSTKLMMMMMMMMMITMMSMMMMMMIVMMMMVPGIKEGIPISLRVTSIERITSSSTGSTIIILVAVVN